MRMLRLVRRYDGEYPPRTEVIPAFPQFVHASGNHSLSDHPPADLVDCPNCHVTH